MDVPSAFVVSVVYPTGNYIRIRRNEIVAFRFNLVAAEIEEEWNMSEGTVRFIFFVKFSWSVKVTVVRNAVTNLLTEILLKYHKNVLFFGFGSVRLNPEFNSNATAWDLRYRNFVSLSVRRRQQIWARRPLIKKTRTYRNPILAARSRNDFVIYLTDNRNATILPVRGTIVIVNYLNARTPRRRTTLYLRSGRRRCLFFSILKNDFFYIVTTDAPYFRQNNIIRHVQWRDRWVGKGLSCSSNSNYNRLFFCSKRIYRRCVEAR